jgi:hypothetical protein
MNRHLKIKSEDQLTKLLQLVAEASAREAIFEMSTEKKAQEDMSDELIGFRAPENAGKEEDLDDDEDEVEEAEDEDEEPRKEKPRKDLTKLGSADTTPDKASAPSSQEVLGADLGDVIKSLNKIRSGKSLKDEMTKRELNDYLKSLSDGERQSLFVFLDGLSQIMAGGVAGNKAPDPGAAGIKISATTKVLDPANTKKKRSASSPSPASHKTPAGEAQPIIVGEVANKDKIRYTARLLMKK